MLKNRIYFKGIKQDKAEIRRRLNKLQIFFDNLIEYSTNDNCEFIGKINIALKYKRKGAKDENK